MYCMGDRFSTIFQLRLTSTVTLILKHTLKLHQQCWDRVSCGTNVSSNPILKPALSAGAKVAASHLKLMNSGANQSLNTVGVGPDWARVGGVEVREGWGR